MTPEPSAAHAGQLERAVADFFEALERGESPDRTALLTQHHDIADELAAFFADHDRFVSFIAPQAASSSSQASPFDSTKTRAESHADLPPTLAAVHLPAQHTHRPASSRLGPYELQRVIGRGGMGIVYQARHVELNRTVALKTILDDRFASAVDRERFAAEARLAANLNHPGIVPIYEVNESGGVPFLAMQLIEGDSLAHLLKSGPLPPLAAARLLRKIAAAVAHAHSQGVIHRDLKPGNILIGRTEPAAAVKPILPDWDTCEPRITDFGLAKRLDDGSHLTATGDVLGTPSYMPPEQASGRLGEVGKPADIYALGAILYSLLTARPPFDSNSAVEVILQVLEREPVLPTRLAPSVPRELEWICLKCLEKNPANRYATADELAADLDRFLRHEPLEARRLTAGRWLRRAVRRRPVLAAHLIGIVSTLVIAQVVFLMHPARESIYHSRLSGVLLLWLVASGLFQWLLERERSSDWPLYAWSAADAAFFTAVLLQVTPPIGVFVAGFGLLICVAGLAGMTRLVTFTTAAALASYVVLLILRPGEFEPIHCTFLALTMALTGLTVGYQVWRMRVLREYYGDRQP